MRITNATIKGLHIEDECPHCNRVCGTDMGTFYVTERYMDEGIITELPKQVHFFCIDCNDEWKNL